ncbi:MAG: guanylate kinase [Christensenellales bacterium]|jgi:guanylate kinase
MKKGILMVVSGPSGVGKDAVRIKLLERCPGLYSSVSATTRTKRPGEKNGIDYIFLTAEEFLCMVEEGEFLEHTEYNGNSYGTPISFVREQLDKGKDILLKIEVKGALEVKKAFPEALLVFMIPPTMEELWRRLVNRGTGNREECANRFKLAYEEMSYADQYDYVVVNDELEDTIDAIRAIYMAYGFRCDRNIDLCRNLLKEDVRI